MPCTPSLNSMPPSPPSPCPPALTLDQVSLRTMNALARKLRAARAERGALTLASPEVKFEIDTETHDPLDVGMYQASAPSCRLLAVPHYSCPYPLPHPTPPLRPSP